MIIRFSGAVLRHVDYRREIRIDATSLRQALDMLVSECPNVKPMLYDARGQVRGVHRLYLGQEQMDATDLDREIKPDDCITVVTAIAGG